MICMICQLTAHFAGPGMSLSQIDISYFINMIFLKFHSGLKMTTCTNLTFKHGNPERERMLSRFVRYLKAFLGHQTCKWCHDVMR